MTPSITSHPRLYRLFRRSAERVPRMRRAVAIMLGVSALVLALATSRVGKRHEVVRLGYQLSQSSEELRHAKELGRRLELERATLTDPSRIRTLATSLGMVPVPPDQIRIVPVNAPVASVTAASNKKKSDVVDANREGDRGVLR